MCLTGQHDRNVQLLWYAHIKSSFRHAVVHISARQGSSKDALKQKRVLSSDADY